MWLKNVMFSCLENKNKVASIREKLRQKVNHAPVMCIYYCKLTVTLDLRVPPEQFSALAAGSAPKAGLTGTLTADLRTVTHFLKTQ